MGIDDISSSLPQGACADAVLESIFSKQLSMFVLPTHLSLEKLHETEDILVEYGGNLTYDITEASLILGKIGQKKRAALELRSRGLWTEEISESRKSNGKPKASPAKRRKTDNADSFLDAGIEIIDLGTESENEGDGVKSCHGPVGHVVPAGSVGLNTVAVLKLEWLDQSIKAGKALPHEPFLVYRGTKTTTTKPVSSAEATVEKLPSQIIERAKEDALQKPPSVPPSQFHPRRSKDPPDGASSQWHPPTLFRQTTSEHDEKANLEPMPDWVRDQVAYACLRSAPLHPPNEEFISQLVKIRQIRELTLDQIGVRAYSTSIAALAAYPYLIQRPSEILTLPGCEAKIANIFAEFQRDGNCNHTDDDGNVAAAHALETDPVLQVLNTFYQIWGVGAKTARDFYHQRGWRDLDDVVEHGWGSLSRVQQIGVKFYDEFQEGISRPESEAIADVVRNHAHRVRPGTEGIDCVIVGGYRRGKEVSGDVDIMVTHPEDAITHNLVVDIVASLETEKYITHTLSLHLTSTHREQQTKAFHGDETGKHFDSLDKALVVWQDPHFDETESKSHASPSRQRNPNPHRRVDIIISPWRTVGCAILGWTGDTTFQRDIRRFAKKTRAWKFDSSGVRERTSGRVIDLERGGNTWEEREKLAMEGLGIGWRPPEERCSK